jgi:hypothetical protein
MFLEQVQACIAGRLFCVTEDGCLGLVSKKKGPGTWVTLLQEVKYP